MDKSTARRSKRKMRRKMQVKRELNLNTTMRPMRMLFRTRTTATKTQYKRSTRKMSKQVEMMMMTRLSLVMSNSTNSCFKYRISLISTRSKRLRIPRLCTVKMKMATR